MVVPFPFGMVPLYHLVGALSVEKQKVNKKDKIKTSLRGQDEQIVV
jgi:hypothetical protein